MTKQAQQNMKEFNPSSELHHPLMLIKRVDPGCTEELQLENCLTGEVIRITSTEDPARDLLAMTSAIITMFKQTWEESVL